MTAAGFAAGTVGWVAAAAGSVVELRSTVGGLLKGAEYRRQLARHAELERLHTAQRRTPLVTTLLGPPLQITDGPSFWWSYQEIFEREMYAFPSNSASPYIVDGGASIGLSILYFKRRYPASEIVAFEADPAIYGVLETNVRRFGLTDVRLVNRALWSEDTEVAFAVEGADAGRIWNGNGDPIGPIIQISTTRLRPYLERPVDFLKLDIEGAETEVLVDCADLLGHVRSVFVEYHSFVQEQQRLDEVLAVLRNAGFRVQIETVKKSPQPLLRRPEQLGMDLQVNTFGWRS